MIVEPAVCHQTTVQEVEPSLLPDTAPLFYLLLVFFFSFISVHFVPNSPEKSGEWAHFELSVNGVRFPFFIFGREPVDKRTA